MPSQLQQRFQTNPAESEDRFAESLTKVSPWLACHMIEDRYKHGELDRDDALVLLHMHAERVQVDLACMHLRISAVARSVPRTDQADGIA